MQTTSIVARYLTARHQDHSKDDKIVEVAGVQPSHMHFQVSNQLWRTVNFVFHNDQDGAGELEEKLKSEFGGVDSEVQIIREER